MPMEAQLAQDMCHLWMHVQSGPDLAGMLAVTALIVELDGSGIQTIHGSSVSVGRPRRVSKC